MIKINRFEKRCSLFGIVILMLLAVWDVTIRIWPERLSISERQAPTVEEFSTVRYNSSVDQLNDLFARLNPPEPEQKSTAQPSDKPPQPQGPTKEQQLQRLVDGGAKRLGEDVVYLRGVLVADTTYAFINLVDKDVQEKSVTVTVGENVAGFEVTEISETKLVLTNQLNSEDVVILQLFEF